jgi:hypothetical protein
VDNFADTAALAVQINVIVTVDTPVAHLAGGLGSPVRGMPPFNPTGAGCWAAGTAPGIPPRGYSVSHEGAPGATSSKP